MLWRAKVCLLFFLWQNLGVALVVAGRGSTFSYFKTNSRLTRPGYNFAYGVSDKSSGVFHSHRQMREGNSVVGEYSVKLPDGRVLTVKYFTDRHGGFQARTSYSYEDFNDPNYEDLG